MVDIEIIKTNVHEAETLLDIQKQAFQSDFEKYKDYQTSPAVESLNSLINRILFSQHYTVYIQNKMAGAIDIRRISPDYFRLQQICLKAEYQNHGYGTKIINMIEKKFPKVKKWSLNTPKDNLRNRHFYEKAGYYIVGETRINRRLTLIEYEKKISD